jgi:flagellar basal body-associated protein FliL
MDPQKHSNNSIIIIIIIIVIILAGAGAVVLSNSGPAPTPPAVTQPTNTLVPTQKEGRVRMETFYLTDTPAP